MQSLWESGRLYRELRQRRGGLWPVSDRVFGFDGHWYVTFNRTGKWGIANGYPAALPSVLAHSGAIEVPAMIMSIFGGLLIYGTIISFTLFFREQEEF